MKGLLCSGQVDKKLGIADIAERINSEFADELTCLFNDDNAARLILRVRPGSSFVVQQRLIERNYRAPGALQQIA